MKCLCTLLSNFFVLKKLIIPLLLAFFGWRFFKKYKAVDELSWRITGAKLSKNPLGVLVTFKIENPTKTDLEISGIFGDIFINSINAGRLLSYDKQIISAQSSSNFSYVIKPSLVGAVSVIKQLLKTGLKNVSVKFVGKVISNGIEFNADSSLSL